jgi:hypothetical protein
MKITKTIAAQVGARGLEVPTSGLRDESFAYLRGGGKASRRHPVTLAVDVETGKRSIVDGRHRILEARREGAPWIQGVIEGRGPRGGLIWRYKGWFQI